MKLKDLIGKASIHKNKTIAVAHAEDEEVIRAVKLAAEHLSARFLLTGDSTKLNELTSSMQGHQVEIVHADTPEESAKLAVRAVHHKTADVLMKGNVPTSVLLKAVLNRQEGLRSASVLSHVAVFDIPDFDRLMFVTDSAMNIAPSLEELRQIFAKCRSCGPCSGEQYAKSSCPCSGRNGEP